MFYSFSSECPVKWTATQEKSISREFPGRSQSSETAAEERMSRIYFQFLWLPESIMPLSRLTPAVLRVLNPNVLSSSLLGPSQAQALHTLLKPFLLTPRSSSQKYQSRVAQLLVNEECSIPEDEMMWYAIKYEKTELDDEQPDEQEQEAADERWRVNWLQRMERREVMIQILLHFLLLSLPTPCSPPMSVSPRKRKRGSRDAESSDAAAAAITPSLEERLEALMDKLSIWQLMGSIDNAVGGDETQRKPSSAWKGKQKAGDERDWMQTFCEDVVAPLFRGSLPSQCALLHDKVFQSSPFSDGSDTLSPSASPPPSPRQKEKQLNTEATSTKTASRSRGPQGLTRTSSSLSITLEEERVRERSKSLSIGPGQIRKRAVTREISMTTAFKGKAAKAKNLGPSAKDKRVRAEEMKRNAAVVGANLAKSVNGTTLVMATPAKPKHNKQQPATWADSPTGERCVDGNSQRGLAAQLQSALTEAAIEGDDDDDEWMVESSPDVLLLGSGGRQDVVVGFDEDLKGGSGAEFRSRVLAEGTPTKRSRHRV